MNEWGGAWLQVVDFVRLPPALEWVRMLSHAIDAFTC